MGLQNVYLLHFPVAIFHFNFPIPPSFPPSSLFSPFLSLSSSLLSLSSLCLFSLFLFRYSFPPLFYLLFLVVLCSHFFTSFYHFLLSFLSTHISLIRLYYFKITMIKPFPFYCHYYALAYTI